MKLNPLLHLKKKPKDIHKILFVTLSNLGDVILTLPALQSLRVSYPEALVDVICGPSGSVVFQGDQRIRKVTPYIKKASLADKFRLLLQVRSERYDMVVDLRRSLFGLLSGARFHNAYFKPLPKKRIHRGTRHLLFLKGLVPLRHTSSFFSGEPMAVMPEGAEILNHFPSAHEKLVVVAPGSKSDLKKWPGTSYAKLLDRLVQAHGCRVVLVGDVSDSQCALSIQKLMTSQVLNLCGKTDFQTLLSVIEKADLVITNDSAPLHMADSLKRPVLALFGPTDPKKYGPRYRHSRVASRTLFCAPCEEAHCRYSHECMTELGVDEVYGIATSILTDTFQKKNFRILVTRLDRIGDLVLSLPAIEAIRKRFPNAFISVMTRPSTAEIVEGNPSIDEVIPYFYEKGGRHSSIIGNWRFIREIAKRRLDVVFILHPGKREYLVPFMAGIPYRVGFKTRFSWLLTHQTPDHRAEGKKHESEYTLDVVRAFGIEEDEKTCPRVYFFAEHERRATDLLGNRSGTMIALHAGASCPSKRWPVEKFAETARLIGEKIPDAFFVIVGGEAERELGRQLIAVLGVRSLDLTGCLGLKELAAVLSKTKLLISNDSGPVHISAAVGTRTLTLFGRSLPGLSSVRWKAMGEGHAYIQKNIGCVVCLAHECTIDFECLQAASPTEVAQKAIEMLILEPRSA